MGSFGVVKFTLCTITIELIQFPLCFIYQETSILYSNAVNDKVAKSNFLISNSYNQRLFFFFGFSDLLVLKQVLEVQLPGKKVTTAAAFWNGLRGQKLKTL